MDRRKFIKITSASAGLALNPSELRWIGQTSPSLTRALVVYIDARIKSSDLLLQQIQSAQSTSPLLKSLSGGNPITRFDGAITDPVDQSLALNHVLLIAQRDDLLLKKAWQREAIIDDGSIYVFGFGNFHGSLGYIESDRNPFLHSANIAEAPFECQLVSMTGTDLRGVEAAVEALINKDLVNGIVAGKGPWIRGSSTLLDRDPLPFSFSIPREIPSSMRGLQRIGVTQASEDEYRGVLADVGVEPISIWRAKYYGSGEWDGAGELAAFRNYSAGLHRRAYGNTVWACTFDSAAAAAAAAPLIARSARLSPNGARWTGIMPPYSWGEAALGDSPQPGTLDLWIEGASVLMQSRMNPVKISASAF